MDEWELLQRFAQQGSQEAFAALVCRHLNFVYSCARRQVRSSHLAEEITQHVFLQLAQQAARLKPGTPLSSWLYVVTRRTALNVLRSERRRQAREQIAYELSAMSPPPSLWEKLAPRLEEALDTLNPRDRSAILLRYFENRPLRDVGLALGATEEAARKRVARALEQLRRFFAREGVLVSVTGLAAELSAHSVEIAPVALGGVITSTACSIAASTPLVASETAHVFAMTTFSKSLLVASLVVISAGLYEVRALARGRDELAKLEQEAAALLAREAEARRENDAAQSRLAASAHPAVRPATPAPAAGDAALAALVARADQMKSRFESDPRLKIPQMALLQETDWLDVARERPIDSEADLRASLANIRARAKGRLTHPLLLALSAYVKANDGRMPATALELGPHITQPLATLDSRSPSAPVSHTALDAMLARYELPSQGSITEVPDKAVLLLESASALIDPDYDTQVCVTRSVSARDTNPLKINTVANSRRGPLAPPPVMFIGEPTPP